MALNKLAHLSLVNKVTTELENHIGIADKTLSEFVIDLSAKHTDARQFQKALEAGGASTRPLYSSPRLNCRDVPVHPYPLVATSTLACPLAPFPAQSTLRTEYFFQLYSPLVPETT
jgi:hypothetical protein